ncbi:MAG: universal stress protein [Desulfobacterales bacterium]|jgi:hypothetical protein
MINKLEFCNILLCTDYSQDADAAFIHAFDQAKKYGGTLHILNVIPTMNPCNVKVFGENLSRKKTITKSRELDEQNRLQALGALKKAVDRVVKQSGTGPDHVVGSLWPGLLLSRSCLLLMQVLSCQHSGA